MRVGVLCHFLNICEDQTPLQGLPSPPQGLLIPLHLKKLLGMMGGVVAPENLVIGVSGFGQ